MVSIYPNIVSLSIYSHVYPNVIPPSSKKHGPATQAKLRMAFAAAASPRAPITWARWWPWDWRIMWIIWIYIIEHMDIHMHIYICIYIIHTHNMIMWDLGINEHVWIITWIYDDLCIYEILWIIWNLILMLMMSNNIPSDLQSIPSISYLQLGLPSIIAIWLSTHGQLSNIFPSINKSK